MEDIVIEESAGLFWVEGGPVLIGQAFASREQALRFARREAGQIHAVILKGEAQ